MTMHKKQTHFLTLLALGVWTAMACVDPDSGYLDYLKRNLHYGEDRHDSYYLIPNTEGTLLRLADVNTSFVKVSLTPQYGDKRCPAKPLAGLVHPSQKNSTCPWNIVKNYDPNRYPKTLWEANCTCETCLESFQEKPTLNRCKSVHYNALVLRRVSCDSNNVYVWKKVLEPIRTGCMCTSVTVKESQRTTTERPGPASNGKTNLIK